MAAKQFGLVHALFGAEDYETWARKKTAFGDAFSRNKALKLKPMIDEHIDKACEVIRARSEIDEITDLAYIFRATPAEIITEYLFGERYGYLEDQATTGMLYDKTYDNVFGLTHLGRFIPFWIPLILAIVRQNLKKAFGSEEPGAAFAGCYRFAELLMMNMEQKHRDGKLSSSKLGHPILFEDFFKNIPEEWKTKDILPQHAMTIWAGGWDTVGSSLTVGTYAVLRNKQVYERLQTELKEAWPVALDPPSMTTLDDLPYLNAVIKETLRMAPGALCRLTRVNTLSPTQCHGYTLPPGTLMSMSLPMVLHDPEIWGPDHDVFRPERWLEQDASRLDRYLVSFSKGTRICPGIELAWVEFRLILGTLFRRFDMRVPQDIEVSDEDIYPYHEGFTPGPKSKKHRLPVEATPLS